MRIESGMLAAIAAWMVAMLAWMWAASAESAVRCTTQYDPSLDRVITRCAESGREERCVTTSRGDGALVTRCERNGQRDYCVTQERDGRLVTWCERGR